MNLIKKINLVLSLAVMATMSSCDDKFEEMNTNPNAAVSVPATNIFGALWPSAKSVVFSTSMTTDYGGAYSGHFGVVDYTYRSNINDPVWTNLYDAMNTCVTTMEYALDEGNDNLYAAALTMKVFFGNKCVNTFGDMPYEEAFDVEEYLHPNYNTQKEVYLLQLEELKTALDIFDEDGEDLGDGDLLFGSDIDKWIKFTNSLRLRLAIRANSGEEGLVDDVFTDIMKYPLIESNDDNAYWWAAGTVSYQETWYTAAYYSRNTDGLKTSGPRAQEAFIDALVEINDPRISIFMEPNSSGEYKGYYMGYAQSANAANNDATYQLCGVGDFFCADAAGFAPLMNATEVYLCLAEAALDGRISGSAQTYYETGVRTHCEELGVETANIETFLAEEGVAWGSGETSDFYKIALQKWISFYKQGFEAWTEIRRTDVPVVTAIQEDFVGKHNRPPFKFPQSTDEAATNDNAPTGQDETDIWWGSRLWWDQREGVY